MTDDYYRRRAYDAVSAWIDTHSSNTVASSQIWQAVNVALDRFEEELSQDTENRPGYVVMLGEKPVLVVNTARQARQQRRYIRRMFPARGYRIAKVQLAVD